MKINKIILIILSLFLFVPARQVLAQSPVIIVGTPPSSVRVYEKYEVRFTVSTNSQYPFFVYDEVPPPGVIPKIGITVEGNFIHAGKTQTQPGFYTTEVIKNGSEEGMWFEETNKKYWVIRFSPQEAGDYQVSIHVKDAQQDVTVPIGSFSVPATPPVKKGFIGVSKADTRYFEFSNGDIYWPTGPAWAKNQSANPNATWYDYSQYLGTGLNLERQWMIGEGAYTGNSARWISSSEHQGNEGITQRLEFTERYPGHDASYPLFYPTGFRMWLPRWEQDKYAARFYSGTKYRLKITYKTANVSGPSSRCPTCPYGFVVRNHGFYSHEQPINETENDLRSKPIFFGHDNQNHDWQTITRDFTTGSYVDTDLSLYLDNVNGGNVYIDEFSMKECLTSDCTSLGGELIRNPRADIHTYVEPRAAAFFDWQVEQSEQNGVYQKYVVHDKNDPIQAQLRKDGTFAPWDQWGDGYYQDYNTKARWLLRQWYRYLAARWGYSTAIHSWELNNEGDPNDYWHWVAAQEFARDIKSYDSHPHLATTSLWCCWRPDYWGNKSGEFPDLGYADLHEYTGNPQTISQFLGYDMAAWLSEVTKVIAADSIGKPTIIGETGIVALGGSSPIGDLQSPNPGVWYHNLLWASLSPGSVTAPNYWWSEHIREINREAISKPFSEFVSSLDVNKGGYVDVLASVSNTKIRAWGQKNLAKDKAYLWIQNSDHTWKNVMNQFGANDGNVSLQSGTVTIRMNPTISYTIEWWDTYTGTKTTTTQSSNSSGDLALTISNLGKDTAIKIYSSTTPLPGDLNGDGHVDIVDLRYFLTNFSNIFNYNLMVGNFGR